MGIRRDQEKQHEDPVASASERAVTDEAEVALTPEEERGILEAIASIEAGHGLPFDEVMEELENFEDL